MDARGPAVGRPGSLGAEPDPVSRTRRGAVAAAHGAVLGQPGHVGRAPARVARRRADLGTDRDAADAPAGTFVRQPIHVTPDGAGCCRSSTAVRGPARNGTAASTTAPSCAPPTRARSWQRIEVPREPRLRAHEHRAGGRRRRAARFLPQPLGRQHLRHPQRRRRPDLARAPADRAAEQQLVDPGAAAGRRAAGDDLQRQQRARRHRAARIALRRAGGRRRAGRGRQARGAPRRRRPPAAPSGARRGRR